MSGRRLLVLITAVSLIVAAAIAAPVFAQQPDKPKNGSSSIKHPPLAAGKSWLDSYWFHPLPPQGKAPKGYTDVEGSLMPEDCGLCHEKQLSEWMTSRHSMSMGHGVMGQLSFPWLKPSEQIACQNCHAPLYEQYPYINANGSVIRNRKYDEQLRHQGVACAGCHVRKQVRYGPPAKNWVEPEAPHGGFVPIKDFGRSEFCKPCHQFNDGERRVNGKLLQDTYNQWKASPAAAEGKSCADCHMPDRSHTFRGVHSQRIVKDGVTITIEKEINSATLKVKNTGTGHKFPTYVTPKISVTGKVVRLDGTVVENTTIEHVIQWKVGLDMKTEYFDTRLDPGETLRCYFKFPEEYSGNIYEIEIMVYPDEYYSRFFASIVVDKPEGIDINLIKKALEETEKSPYSIYKRRIGF